MNGGPTHAIHQAARALTGAGVEVDIATTRYCDGLSGSTALRVLENGIAVHYFPSKIPSWRYSPQLASWVYAHARNYDLVHLHNVFSYPATITAKIAYRYGVPYVLQPHGMLDPWCRARKRWKKGPYYYALERTNLKNASAIHVSAEAEANSLRALGFGEKTFVIPHAVDLPDTPERRRAAGEPLRVLYLSRLDPKKRLTVLLDAIYLLRRRGTPVHLMIGGDGDHNYRAAVMHRIENLNLSDAVTFLGWLTKDAAARVRASADLFVLPSAQENFGIAVAEAMASGLPVIVSERVALAEYVTRAHAGAVVPLDDRETLADAIQWFRSPELRWRAGANARALVQKEFDSTLLAGRLLRMYQHVLRGTASPQTSQHLSRIGA